VVPAQVGKKATPAKAQKPRKKAAEKKAAPKREEKRKVAAAKRLRNKSKRMGEAAVPPERRGSRSGEQSGDLQGLSRLEAADSESVDELNVGGECVRGRRRRWCRERWGRRREGSPYARGARG
jgi:hypothetical protein